MTKTALKALEEDKALYQEQKHCEQILEGIKRQRAVVHEKLVSEFDRLLALGEKQTLETDGYTLTRVQTEQPSWKMSEAAEAPQAYIREAVRSLIEAGFRKLTPVTRFVSTLKFS